MNDNYQHPALEKVRSFLKAAGMKVSMSLKGAPIVMMNGKFLDFYSKKGEDFSAKIAKRLDVSDLAVRSCISDIAVENAEPWD